MLSDGANLRHAADTKKLKAKKKQHQHENRRAFPHGLGSDKGSSSARDRNRASPAKLPSVHPVSPEDLRHNAPAHDVKLNELLVKSSESYRKQQGD
jgi:hypothetical protein